MVIETKFNLGDEVYPIFSSASWKIIEVCPVCTSTGKVKIENLDLYTNCPECYGTGGINKKLIYTWRAGNCIINIGSIHIYENDENGSYVMYEDYNDDRYSEEDLFSSKEDALKECEKRNNLENGNKD